MLELNKIYLGDGLEFTRQLDDNSVDLIVTDPPYEVSNCGGGKGGFSEKTKKLKNSLNDISDGFDIDLHLSEWERVLKKFNAFIFCSNKQISTLMKWGEDRGYSTTCLIWHKYNAMPLCNGVWNGDIEYCIHIRESGATFQGGIDLKRKVFRESIVKSEYDHPTVKPLELIKKYIQIGSNEGDTVLDPFMGSGTTAHACIHLNRNFIGFEISEKYFNIANDRIQRAYGNTGLFALESA